MIMSAVSSVRLAQLLRFIALLTSRLAHSIHILDFAVYLVGASITYVLFFLEPLGDASHADLKP